MTIIYCAYSEPINPAGVSPVLTRDQIWKGLQRKIRHAQDFVPVITGCDVIEEKGNEVVRVAHFKEMMGKPPTSVREVCNSYYPTKVDFWQPDGALITNTISDGPGLGDVNLHMTYTFEWRHPEIAEGSKEQKEAHASRVKDAQMAVHKSIEAMRAMAVAGELD